ncbi:adenosine deaminase [Pelagibius sp. Alg239-R121]|uniref:adenosine deaminase n=1 Tax=Pelagibius sp. Alg239-R121 TaxID=2993448 RepID=UPI0024A67F6A|nr:adenosine deaminase [Pelagibius sp. Alg239-R121]
MTELHNFIDGLPKAELHLHIEGTLEPDMMFALAERNRVVLPYASVEEVQAAYSFSNLQEFLNLYYQGAQVLITEQDFYDLTVAYLKRARADNVIHTEIFFDPQAHTVRGINFDTVVNGIARAMDDAERDLGISSELILCFLRHLSEEEALETFSIALRHREKIIGFGLDSSEKGHPPAKFQQVFSLAKDEGFRIVAHAGEEGPPDYVFEALDLLKVDRIDHGNRALEDAALIERLAHEAMPLTVCPLSNLSLAVVKDLADHPLRRMLDAGLMATLNSDDPAYFGGYVNQNYKAMQSALNLTRDELALLARNSFEASFISEGRKAKLMARLDGYLAQA